MPGEQLPDHKVGGCAAGARWSRVDSTFTEHQAAVGIALQHAEIDFGQGLEGADANQKGKARPAQTSGFTVQEQAIGHRGAPKRPGQVEGCDQGIQGGYHMSAKGEMLEAGV